ncbi:PAAR domain-containing protein [Psychromonas sp. SP041]|nr:PAAR domain-containing protein [Psychromonas sp. SP041]
MGKPAATISSYHMCPIKRLKNLTIVAGAANVLIGGLPVALIGDKCVCV